MLGNLPTRRPQNHAPGPCCTNAARMPGHCARDVRHDAFGTHPASKGAVAAQSGILLSVMFKQTVGQRIGHLRHDRRKARKKSFNICSSTELLLLRQTHLERHRPAYAYVLDCASLGSTGWPFLCLHPPASELCMGVASARPCVKPVTKP